MARIRSVHPGLWTDEAYMEMTMTARAAWPALWTVCDDRGVFDWKPKGLKAAIFPADAVDFAPILDEWRALGVVCLVEIEGKPCGLVKNFCKFQSPKFPSYRYELTEEMLKFVKWKPKPSTKSDEPSGDDSVGDTEKPEDQHHEPSVAIQKSTDKSATALPQTSANPTPVLPHGEERRGEEKKDSEATPLATADAAPPAPIDARTEIWRGGLTILRRLTGKAEGTSRAFMGRFVKALADDCAAGMAILHEAEDLRPGEPEAWLMAAANARNRRAETGISARKERILRAGGLWPAGGTTIDHTPNPQELL